MHPLSTAALLEKNKMAGDGVMVILLEIELSTGDTLRVCSDNVDTVWNGNTFIAFPFSLDQIGESRKGEIPQVACRVANATRQIQYYLEQSNGGVGSTVHIYLVNTNLLTETVPLLALEYIVAATTSDAQWVTFTLAGTNSYTQRFPLRRILRGFCDWKFKDVSCGYTGAATTCDNTLGTCRALGNSSRFGGFPGVGGGAIYV